jgi:hypothetical protein
MELCKKRPRSPNTGYLILLINNYNILKVHWYSEYPNCMLVISVLFFTKSMTFVTSITFAAILMMVNQIS